MHSACSSGDGRIFSRIYLQFHVFHQIDSQCEMLLSKCIWLKSFSPSRMTQWRYRMVDCAEFWISCKRPAFLISFSFKFSRLNQHLPMEHQWPIFSLVAFLSSIGSNFSNFGVFKSSQKANRMFDLAFFFGWLFGRFEDTKISFWD